MSQHPIDLPEQYAEDWIPMPPDSNTKPWAPASADMFSKAFENVLRIQTSRDGEEISLAQTVTVQTPNGTRVRLSVDEITGGLRVTQVQDEAGRGMLSAVPMGLGALLLDDRA